MKVMFFPEQSIPTGPSCSVSQARDEGMAQPGQASSQSGDVQLWQQTGGPWLCLGNKLGQ